MNLKRRSRVKQQKKERRKFYIALARTKKTQHALYKMQRRNQEGVLVTFFFNPDELGVSVFANQQSIEKLGLERAWQRLDRQDFFKYVSTRVKGNPTKEYLAEIRKEVLVRTKAKLNAPRLDLSDLTTVETESSNEINTTTD